MKRAFDIVVGSVLLVLFCVPMIFVAFLVMVFMGRPVVFRQRRPGLRGRPFQILKFRTMRAAYDPEGRPLPDDARLTPFGQFLRATSLDELPELFNVLAGNMSLVGPRPLLMEYLDRYSTEQARRHEVRPGITGWAQVNGRNAITWERKFTLDVWYVDNHNLWLDVRILGMTVLKVLTRHGITAENHVTGVEFRGSTSEKSV